MRFPRYETHPFTSLHAPNYLEALRPSALATLLMQRYLCGMSYRTAYWLRGSCGSTVLQIDSRGGVNAPRSCRALLVTALRKRSSSGRWHEAIGHSVALFPASVSVDTLAAEPGRLREAMNNRNIRSMQGTVGADSVNAGTGSGAG
jgi:hypothetical protein